MSFEKYLLDRLQENGLFEKEARAVVDLMKVDKANESMNGRWNDDLDDYPASMTIVLWASACINTVRWIDENKPLHWARPVFAPKSQ